MLDIKWVRENPDALNRALANRGAEAAAERLIALDAARREAVQRSQEAQTRRNSASKEIGQAKAQKDEARAQALMAEVASLKDAIKAAEEEERAAQHALDEALAVIPNVPLEGEAPEAPPVGDESANLEVRRWGESRELSGAKEHFELGEAMGLMDFEAAAKLSGSRFVVLKGGLARLERALGQFMLDLHTLEHGYEEVQPPILVNDEALFGTAQLPKFAEDQFKTFRRPEPNDLFDETWDALARITTGGRDALFELVDIGREHEVQRLKAEHRHNWDAIWDQFEKLGIQAWLIPTAEVPLTNLVRDSILAEDALPIRYTALTPCFRSEAGSAGRDTRGMLRQHQFNKVELVSITTPDQSRDEHERMTACAEEVLKRLGLAYRTVLLSTGDMGFASQKTYDLEVWLPGQKAYREISSCSVCGDFQARRMDARYRSKDAKQPRFVHTLNGSGVAVGRALIAVMETYQNEDGSITVPDVLRPYMGGLERVGG
jgi:seryl-tRNA synthetase